MQEGNKQNLRKTNASLGFEVLSSNRVVTYEKHGHFKN